jgi:hypothetical protein
MQYCEYFYSAVIYSIEHHMFATRLCDLRGLAIQFLYKLFYGKVIN